MNNSFLETIKTRRSCRHYKAEQITDDELNAVLEAGTYAPTGHGKQDPVIVAVQNANVKARLAKMNAAIMGVDSNPYYDAPTYVLVFASEGNANAVKDGSCVLENMMCWINREQEMFQTEEGKKMMKELGLADGLIGIGAISLGYASREPRPAAPRKEGWIKIVK